MFHFSFRVALSMNSLMFESSISDFLIFLSLKVLHLATYPTLNHTHPEHSRTSPNLLSSEAWPAGLCCGWRVCGRDWGQKPTGIASCSPACINGCKKSQEQIIPRTAGGFFLSHKVPLAHPKREQRSKNTYEHAYKAAGQETRNWKWDHSECISQKIHGKSQSNWLLEFFPKLKTILFCWNQWIIAHGHSNSNLKEF